MFFSKSVITVAALGLSQIALAALNPFIYPPTGEKVEVGKPITIAWKNDGGKTITLHLRKGESTNLDTLDTIVAKLPNSGKFTWTPPKEIESGEDYAFMITDDETGEQNYTGLFAFESDVPAGSKTTATTASATKTSTETSAAKTSSAADAEETDDEEEKKDDKSESSTPAKSAAPKETSEPEDEDAESAAGAISRSPLALVFCLIAAVAYLN